MSQIAEWLQKQPDPEAAMKSLAKSAGMTAEELHQIILGDLHLQHKQARKIARETGISPYALVSENAADIKNRHGAGGISWAEAMRQRSRRDKEYE